MKPRIDISAKQRFTIWESGNWNDKENIGRATLVAGPDGERLPVIFDTNPEKYVFQYLFFADVDQVVAMVFVRNRGEHFQYDISMSKIVNLTTKNVQGNPVAHANMESLFKLKESGSADFIPMLERAYNKDRMGYKETYAELLKQAVTKAFTKAQEQHLFWGVSRTTNAE